MDSKLENTQRPISVASAGVRIVVIAIVLLTKLAILSSNHHSLVDCAAPSSSFGASFGANDTNPLTYKRLRFDFQFMQIYRRYQKYLSADEHRESIKVNQKLWNGATNKFDSHEVELEYYQNDQVEATNFTYDDLVFEALDRAYLTRLWPAFVYNYDDKNDIRKASDPELVSRSKCDHELSYLVEQIRKIDRARVIPSKQGLHLSNAINHELLGFFDAYANEESGLLLGNNHWTGGNWRECSRRLVFNVDKTNLSNSVDFTGRYCLASLRSEAWDAKVDERAKELEKRHYFKYPSQEFNYKRFHRVQVGICLPQSCDSQIVSSRRADIHRLATFKLSYPVRAYNLVDLYCLPDETSELRQLEPAGRLFVFVSIVWLSLIALATYFDHKHTVASAAKATSPPTTTGQAQQQRRPQLTFGQKLVSSFSLIRNFERLTETKSCQPLPPLSSRLGYLKDADGAEGQAGQGKQQSDQASQGSPKLLPNDLLFLNGIKVLGMVMVVYGHTGMLHKQLDRFVLDYDCQTRYLNSLQLSGGFYVNLFFVISSFLMTYMMFVTNRVARHSVIDWIYSVVHRYFRLAPIYIVLVWFCQSIFMHTSSGPLWDYGSNNMTFRSICRRESFWYPLTLTANFHPIHQECVMPGWYVSSDMQFSLIVPFLLVLLHKSVMLGWLVTGSIIVGSLAMSMHRYRVDPTAQHLELMRPRADIFARYVYEADEVYRLPHYRVGGYLIGLLAGHYAYMVLSGKWKSAIFFVPATGFAGKPEGQLKSALKLAAWRRMLVGIFGPFLFYIMVTSTYWVDELFATKWEPYARDFVTVIYGHSHSAASLGVALTLVAFMFGQWESLRQFLSHPAWSIMSRINYVLLVIQVEVMNWVLQSGDRLVEFNTISMLKVFFQVVAIVYPLAALLALIVEQPLAQLEQHFIAPIFKPMSSPSRGADQQAATSNTGAERSGHEKEASEAQGNSDATNKSNSNK